MLGSKEFSVSCFYQVINIHTLADILPIFAGFSLHIIINFAIRISEAAMGVGLF
jgi:hypothetical protein